MKNFKQYCMSITYPNIPNTESESTDLNIQLHEKIKNIGQYVREKIDFIDRVSIPFVEKKFEDVDSVVDALIATGQEDIPDNILNAFAKNIFGCIFNELESGWKRSIIAVLGVYILI